MLALFHAMEVFDRYLFVEHLRRNAIVSEIVFKSYAVNHGAPISKD